MRGLLSPTPERPEQNLSTAGQQQTPPEYFRTKSRVLSEIYRFGEKFRIKHCANDLEMEIFVRKYLESANKAENVTQLEKIENELEGIATKYEGTFKAFTQQMVKLKTEGSSLMHSSRIEKAEEIEKIMGSIPIEERHLVGDFTTDNKLVKKVHSAMATHRSWFRATKPDYTAKAAETFNEFKKAINKSKTPSESLQDTPQSPQSKP